MVYLRRSLLALLFAGVACLAYLFPTSNLAPLSLGIDFFGQSWRLPAMPTWVVVVLAYLFGVGTATVALVWKIMKQSLAGRRYRKTVAGLESEIHQLRNLPLEGADDVGSDPALVKTKTASSAKFGA